MSASGAAPGIIRYILYPQIIDQTTKILYHARLLRSVSVGMKLFGLLDEISFAALIMV
jgi:hypothetical protein